MREYRWINDAYKQKHLRSIQSSKFQIYYCKHTPELQKTGVILLLFGLDFYSDMHNVS